MKRPIKRALVVLTGTAVMLAAVGAVALAQSFFEADGTVHFCSDAATRAARLIMVGESCSNEEYGVDIRSGGGAPGPAGPTGATGPTGPAGPAGISNVLAVHRNTGPTTSTPIFATVITLSNVPPGNYVAIAKTNITKNTAAVVLNTWTCNLVVSPPGGPSGIVDTWTENGFSFTTVANLQRPLMLDATLATSYTVQLSCQVNTATGWSAANSSIILTQVTTFDEDEVNQ
jgi:hypothetical protein